MYELHIELDYLFTLHIKYTFIQTNMYNFDTLYNLTFWCPALIFVDVILPLKISKVLMQGIFSYILDQSFINIILYRKLF